MKNTDIKNIILSGESIKLYPSMQFNYKEISNAFVAELVYTQQKVSSKIIGGLTGGLTGGLNSREKLVFDIIIEKPGINVKRLNENTDIPIDTLDKYIRKLVSLKMIERRGSKKTGGYWKIVKN